jgi:hypothetical protein
MPDIYCSKNSALLPSVAAVVSIWVQIFYAPQMFVGKIFLLAYRPCLMPTGADESPLLTCFNIALHFGVLLWRPFSEYGATNSDLAAPLAYCALKIRAHAHTQLQIFSL